RPRLLDEGAGRRGTGDRACPARPATQEEGQAITRLILSLASLAACGGAAASRPNFAFLFADDQWHDALGVVLKQWNLSVITAGSADPWLGQKVLARKAGSSLTDTGKDGTPVTLPVRHIVYTVVAEDGDRVQVNYPGQEGWAARAEWVRLSDAMGYFTGRIKADPTDSFAWSRRGVANRYAGKPELALKDLEEAV